MSLSSVEPLPKLQNSPARAYGTPARSGASPLTTVRKMRSRLGAYVEAAGVPWILPGVILVLWQLSAATGLISSSFLPEPVAILKAGWRLILSGELLTNLLVSAQRAFAGLVVGGGLGFAFGLSNGLSRFSERLTDSTIQMVRNIPLLSLIPLVILWFGIDEGAKLFLVALSVFFPVYVNTLHGIQTVDDKLVEMGRSYGMKGWDLFRRVIFPGALPSVFVGLRYALGTMWVTLIVAETIAAQSGIGYLAMHAREFMQVDVVVLSILVYALLGKLADFAVKLLEHATLQWHPAFQRGVS